MSRTTEKKLDVVIGIRVTLEEKNKLQEEANKEKRTLSNYLKIKLGLI